MLSISSSCLIIAILTIQSIKYTEYTFILEKIHKVLPKALRGNSCTCVTDSVDPLVDDLMQGLPKRRALNFRNIS